MDASEIDTAKQQVQGQMAAQYIQEVMQARMPARQAHTHAARAQHLTRAVSIH